MEHTKKSLWSGRVCIWRADPCLKPVFPWAWPRQPSHHHKNMSGSGLVSRIFSTSRVGAVWCDIARAMRVAPLFMTQMLKGMSYCWTIARHFMFWPLSSHDEHQSPSCCSCRRPTNLTPANMHTSSRIKGLLKLPFPGSRAQPLTFDQYIYLFYNDSAIGRLRVKHNSCQHRWASGKASSKQMPMTALHKDSSTYLSCN